MIKAMKKSMFMLTLLVGCSASLYAQDAAWYETDEWYEQDLGAKKGEANPIHLAITLVECFSHNPKDVIVFDKAIKFWLARGGNINQTFQLRDLILSLSGETGLAQYPAWCQTLTVTVISSLCVASTLVQALLKHQAKVIIPKVNTLDIWVKQYQNFLIAFQESKYAYTNYIDEIFQSHYESLKLLFAACDATQQAAFLQKYPECKIFMEMV